MILPERTEPLSSETTKLVAEYLNDNKKAIELLVKGAAIKESRYPINFSAGFGASMPYLSDIRSGSRLLKLDAILYAGSNEPKEGLPSGKIDVRIG